MTGTPTRVHSDRQDDNGEQSTCSPVLQISDPGPGCRSCPFTGRSVVLGRDAAQCDIVLQGPAVSRIHARIDALGNGKYLLLDLQSTNGVYVNNQKIDGKIPVHHNDIIGLGRPGVSQLRFLLPPYHLKTLGEILPVQSSWTIGRRPDCDVCLPFLPAVSGHHATVESKNGNLFLQDHASLNGTWVNARPIQRVRLHRNDRVSIGGIEFHFHLLENGALQVVQQRQPDKVSLACYGLSCRSVGNKHNHPLLKDISLSIKAGDFVGVLGPSGAGKTSLLKALSGQMAPDSGRVELTGRSLYDAPAMFRSTLAYVPQDDILHPELKVRTSLEYVARLRLPGDTTMEQRRDIINRVLDILDLHRVSEHPIHRLSGGQRKRVSIGAELITRPGMIFLDEPASGLDPGIAARLMRHFKAMSTAGTTVIMTTHSLEQLDLFDKIVLLARGRLVFFGKPTEAVDYFNEFSGQTITRPVDIFHVLDNVPLADYQINSSSQTTDRNAIACFYAEQYKHSPHGVHSADSDTSDSLDNQQTRQDTAVPDNAFNAGNPPVKPVGINPGRVFSLHHWLCLSGRHFRIRLADHRRLLTYLLIPLLLALVTLTLTIKGFPDRTAEQLRRQNLELLVHRGGPFMETSLKTLLSTRGARDPRPAWRIINDLRYQGPANMPVPMSVLVMGIMTAVFLGTVSGCLELSSERHIYQRERSAGLKIFDYLCSKLPFCLTMTALQCLFFTLCCTLHPALTDLSFFPIFFTLLAVAWTSVAMGLCISALDPTSGRFSIMIAVAAVLPQLILSGGLGPEFYRHISMPAKTASLFFPARWGLEMELTAVYSGTQVAWTPWIPECIQKMIGFDFGNSVYYHGIGVLIVQSFTWLLLCAWLLKRRDPV
ncbi:MAG TPA: FHA domain-containing protein [Desulfobulbus sp.]|nr:FHA domain-containing protein [Desulfobulbus sp.]